MFADIVLPLPLEKSFHYAIPAALAPVVRPGARVLVPFGRKQLAGFVVGLPSETTVKGIKDIAAVLDPEPVVSAELLALARWIAATYLCSLGEALAVIAPIALRPPKRVAGTAGTTAAVLLEESASAGPQLTPAQAAAAAAVHAAISARRHDAFLLHGVTGSGKTEVYLSMIAAALAAGTQAIFLLPEISLTPQFIGIVRRRFPGDVGVWHSNLSAGERYRTWDSARTGGIRIMLGARSAVFAPFPHCGLIIIDEEHEPTYKQEQKPAYHAREVALERGRLANAPVVFGSATPSLESFYRAQEKEFHLLTMPHRIDARPLPAVRIVDANRLHRKSRILSVDLMESLTRVLARREQSIMFLNRRGFAPGVVCQDCGQVWQCPRCSISLVYHRAPESLHCHYCDYTQPFPTTCPGCKKQSITIFGVGTQRVEEELKKFFPQGKVCRLDRDTASRKGAYQKAYDDFKQENVDILLGTQMVTKGFDFPRVTLVGVVDADTALYLPDFRSAERTFQLITQAAGRSGRSRLGGEVIVQSRHPEHYALVAARTHDYHGFYAQEIVFRQQMKYPPFCRLVNFFLRGKNEEKVAAAAKKAGEDLTVIRAERRLSFDMLGPSPAAHYKLHNNFRWQIILKGERPALLEAARALRTLPVTAGVLLSIDIDPQDTL